MKFCNSVVTDTLQVLPESVTVCATVDESGDEHIITELMIRRACEQMDAKQLWPCAFDALSETVRTPSVRTAKILPFRTRAIGKGLQHG